MNKGEIILYNDKSNVEIRLDNNSIWLNQKQMAELFDKDSDTIGLHLKYIYATKELSKNATTEEYSVVRQEGNRQVSRKILFYNLNAIISVGYRVNSKRGTQFRIWANQVLKDYLIQGYAINEKRLAQKDEEIKFLKDGIHILTRTVSEAIEEKNSNTTVLETFAKGLGLLDDYDHEQLDTKGLTTKEVAYPRLQDYQELINQMLTEFDSDIFGKQKDESFESAIAQIEKGFENDDFYPSLEEKATMLLYLVVKNHACVDGNKRIAAACFLKFLEQNNMLFNSQQQTIISNDTLASLTLFIASSKPEEMKTVTRLVISVLNRSRIN